MIRTREELVSSLTAMFGDSATDEQLSLLEDVSDTVDAGAENLEWKAKYEENDSQWRSRYRDRFLGKENQPDALLDDFSSQETKVKTYEELFKEE